LYPLAIWALGTAGTWFQPDAALSIHPEFRANLVLAILLVFTATVTDEERRAIDRDLERLAPHLNLAAEEVGRLLARATTSTPWARAIVPLAGGVCGAAIDLADDGLSLASLADSPHDVVRLVMMIALFALLASLASKSVGIGGFFSRLGRYHTRVSLFAPEPLHVFGRRGLRLSLNWFIGSAIASLLVLDASTPELVTSVIVLTLGLGVASLVISARGVHEAVRRAKHAELDRVRADIAREAEALLSAKPGPAASRLPALIAYEGRVVAVREWPFDAPTLVRFGALAALATGSWLGGAVVERMLAIWVP
jgi:hypothetical protein